MQLDWNHVGQAESVVLPMGEDEFAGERVEPDRIGGHRLGGSYGEGVGGLEIVRLRLLSDGFDVEDHYLLDVHLMLHLHLDLGPKRVLQLPHAAGAKQGEGRVGRVGRVRSGRERRLMVQCVWHW